MRKVNWLATKNTSEVADITTRFWNALSPKAYPLTKGELRIPISLEPFTISRPEYDALEKNLLLVISASRKIVENYFIDQELRTAFSLDDAEVLLVESSKDEPLVGIVRADLFYGKGAQMVELNADFPDGFFMHDVTAQTTLAMLDSQYTTASNATLFERLLESEGVNKSDHLFIGYNRGRTFIDEFALTQQQLERDGWEHVSYGAFEDLTYEKNGFYFNNTLVQVIRRGSETSKLRGDTELMANLVTAQKNSGLKIVNNFKMRLLGHKALLAVLWDSRFQHYLNQEEISAIQQTVPKTLKLEAADTSIALIEKNEWVLKPSDLTEGEGVVIGSSCTEAAWGAHLTAALKNPKKWLLQRKVEIPEETFSLFDTTTGETYSSRMHYDLDPHIVLFKDHAEIGNILVRFSPSEILNVMKGGGITYAFIE